jgi:hypothetical protein
MQKLRNMGQVPFSEVFPWINHIIASNFRRDWLTDLPIKYGTILKIRRKRKAAAGSSFVVGFSDVSKYGTGDLWFTKLHNV